MDPVASQQLNREMLFRQLAELEEQVRGLEDDLGRTHRLATLGTLAGSIAHEFNNILTPVMSYAQLALASPEDGDLTRKALQKAIDGTEKAASIASSMLGFIRAETGITVADVRATIDDALSCLARDPAKDGIRVKIDVPSGCAVQIGPVALNQILLNLLLNAIEAIRPCDGAIMIAARVTGGSMWNTDAETPEHAVDHSPPTSPPTPLPTPPDRFVELSMSDTGRGVPEAIRERVFEPLVTGSLEPGKHHGTGLGLSICRRLIRGAGGEIRMESSPDVGTTLRLWLPEADARQLDATHAAA